jgi:hydroxymethylpyrimidine/phosphomethylpyrimidine kinase
MTAVALTIAGSDSSGGAGIQADLKTFAAFAVFGTSAITAITAQNTRGVSGVANLDPAFVAVQIDAVADDFTIAAAKTGMLSRAEIIGAVANRIRVRKIPKVVVDPVMVAASGDVLLDPDAITMMRDVMLPLATVVTPNLREAGILTVLPIYALALKECNPLVESACASKKNSFYEKHPPYECTGPAGVHRQPAVDTRRPMPRLTGSIGTIPNCRSLCCIVPPRCPY